MKNKVLLLDFGSTKTRFQINNKRIEIDTYIPRGICFDEKEDKEILTNIKREWLNDDIHYLALLRYFESIAKDYNIKAIEIKATYPNFFSQKAKIRYKQLLEKAFNVPQRKIELLSEANALLRGAQIHNLKKNVFAADVGGFTTDVFQIVNGKTFTTGTIAGGEEVSSFINSNLKERGIIEDDNLLSCKILKEEYYSEGKINSINIIKDMLISKAYSELLSFNDIFNLIEDSFEEVYGKIAYFLSQTIKDKDSLIYIFGGVADIEAFQNIIKKSLGVNAQFIDDTFILIKGMEEELGEIEVASNDIYVKYYTGIANKPLYLRIAKEGAPFPITFSERFRISKEFPLLEFKILKSFGKAYKVGHEIDDHSFNIHSKDIEPFFNIEKEKILKECSSNEQKVTFTIEKDNISVEVNKVIENVTFQENKEIAQIEQEVKKVYEEEKKRKQEELIQKVELIFKEKLNFDKNFKNIILKEIKKDIKGEKKISEIMLPRIDNYGILNIKNEDDFFNLISKGNVKGLILPEKLFKKEVSLFVKIKEFFIKSDNNSYSFNLKQLKPYEFKYLKALTCCEADGYFDEIKLYINKNI